MTESTLKTFLHQPFSDTVQRTLLGHLFGNSLTLFTHPKILIEQTDTVQNAQQIGFVTLSGGHNLVVIDVAVTDVVQIARNRKGLRDVAAKYIDQTINHGALVFFHNPNQADYRLTFIARYSAFDLDTLDLVKHETAPKRYSFLLSAQESNTTAARRLLMLIEKKGVISLNDLTEAFSVERLNREFFKKFKDTYFANAWHYLAEYYRPVFLGDMAVPEKKEDKEKQEKPIRDFAKKMLGRIVFLHFLQKKGWMGCAKDTTQWVDGDKQFMQTLFRQFPDKDHFYSRGLTELFFETLNNPNRPNSEFSVDGIDLGRIPYLNGGLFDKEMSSNGQTEPTEIDFPSAYFHDLLAFFDSYNFTIDENSPDDNEVGIDPEMLGHIFENLLEENREKGAFYTPRAIVQYMCQESLIQYLTHHLGLPNGQEGIANFIRQGERGSFKDKSNVVATNARRIEKLLDEVKICDPAIGSGAFPMGMLQEIFAAKLTLDWTLDRAETKKRIIQESIYGVDVDPGAVDIARLRFWLALVVDEDEPQPLPNLDYKIMQGNSLLESFEGIRLDKIIEKEQVVYVVENGQMDIFGRVADPQLAMNFSDEKKQELQDLLRLYFDPEALKQHGLKKETVKAQVDVIVHDHLDASFEKVERSLERQIGDLDAEIRDVEAAVRNNPNEPKAKRKQKEDQISRKKKNIDGLQKQLTTIRASQQKLYTIDPANKPYFLWHLFFKDVFDQGGFDIVIGNPPYVQIQKLDEATKAALENQKYETYTRMGDLYQLFYEAGLQLLAPGGHLCYITSNKWMRTDYGKVTRGYFALNYNTKQVVDFGMAQLFESATTYTNILLIAKSKPNNQLAICRIGKDYKPQSLLRDYIAANQIQITNPGEGSWIAYSKREYDLIRRIEAQGKPVKEWDIQINYGIKTGFNDAFVIDTTTRDRLVAEDPRSAEIIKPLLRGEDIKAYVPGWAGKWLVYIPWHFPLHEDSSITGASKKSEELFKKQYPAVFAHLESYKKQLSARNTAETGIRYEWYCLQRWGANYYKDFTKPKIIYPNMTKYMPFVYDKGSFFTNDKSFILTGSWLGYLTAFFNSKIFKFAFREYFPELLGESRELRKVFFETVAIKPVDNEEWYVNQIALIQNNKCNDLSTQTLESEIDEKLFDLYELNQTDRELINLLS